MPATLLSNNGDAQFVIEIGSPSEYACEVGFESSISIRGRHWDGDHSFPFLTSIQGLWLRSEELNKLRERVARWIALPLDRLVVDDLDGEFELACLPGQRVCVRFGSRRDTIADDSHPVVSVAYSAGALQGEFHFVTDQSCLSLFCRDLLTELARLNAS